MEQPPILTFRGVRRSAYVEADILERIQKLETFFQPITACHVVVEFAEKRHGTGNRYRVGIDLMVPDETIAVRHDASLRASARALGLAKLPREDESSPGRKYARIAIREAFDAARRQLLEYARRHRREVKQHSLPVTPPL